MIGKDISEVVSKSKVLKSEQEKNDALLKKYRLELNAILYNLKFYHRFITDATRSDDVISKRLRVDDRSLPYRCCGEGDYCSVIFKLESNRVTLMYHCSYDSSYSCHLASIKYSLFEKGNEQELSDFLDRIIDNRNKKRQEIISKEKEDKKKQLQRQIDELNDQLDG